MTWHDPATELDFSVGEVPPASKLDKIGTDLLHLYQDRDGIMVKGSGGQSIPTSTPTKVVYSSGALYESGTITYAGNYNGSGDITLPAGIWVLTANMLCAGSGQWTIEIRQNGNMCAGGEGQVIGASASIVMKLNASDVISVYVNTTSAATLPVNGFFPNLSCQRIS